MRNGEVDERKSGTIALINLFLAVSHGRALYSVAGENGPGNDAEGVPGEVDDSGVGVPEAFPPGRV